MSGVSVLGSSGWKKNAPSLPMSGHKFQPCDTSKRRCKICRLPLNTEIFGPKEGQAYGCVNLGCRLSRVHLSCMQGITKPCKKVSISSSSLTRTKSARGTSSDPHEMTPDRQYGQNFHYAGILATETKSFPVEEQSSESSEVIEEEEDPRARQLLHAENSYLLFSGLNESSKMMQKRLEAAKERQKKLQAQEIEFKKQLRTKWAEISQKVEAYLDRPCEYLSQTVSVAGETTEVYSSILESLQSEIVMLSNSHKTLSNPLRGGSHIMFNMSAAVKGTTEESEEKPAFLSSLKKSTDRGIREISSIQETVKKGGKLEFSQRFPPSMHQVAESLQYTTSLNSALERCLEIGSLETRKVSEVENLMQSLQDIVESSSTEQEKHKNDDKQMASEIKNHCDILKEFKELLVDVEDSVQSPGLSVHTKLVHPHTGELTEIAVEIMKKIKNTHLVDTRKEKTKFPLLLSPSILHSKSVHSIGKDNMDVDQMIDQLVDVREPNIVKLTSVFLRAYRYFMTPDDLLEKLIYRYCAVPSYNVPCLGSYKAHQLSTRLRTVVFVKTWLSNYSSSDFISLRIFNTLKNFVEDIVLFTGYHSIGKQLTKLLERCPSNPNLCIDQHRVKFSPAEQKSNTELLVKPLVNMVPLRNNIPRRKKKRTSKNVAIPVSVGVNISILDFEPKIFAEQLTAFQFEQFKSIPEIELLQQRYSKDRAPSITANSQHFNRLGGWVLYQLFTATNLYTRVEILRHILSVCICLYQLNNFNGIVSIIAALNNSSVDRLRITWTSAGRNVFIVKEAFANLTRNNYSLYRSNLQSVSPPLIPFIGMFLTDLTYLEDGNPNFLEDGSVNFGKFTKISNSVTQLLGYQDFDYQITLDKDFRLMFEGLNTLSEDDSYTHSEQLEPRKLTSTVQKFEKLTPDEDAFANEVLRNIRNKIITNINDIAPKEPDEFPSDMETDKPLEKKKRVKTMRRRSTQV